MKGSMGGRDRALHITGGEQLAGKICVSGSKNAALPEMAAALLTTEPVTLQNVPRVTDTVVMGEIISLLGGHTSGEGTVVIDAGAAGKTDVPDGLGTERLIVDGTTDLSGAEHTVISDYLEAGTYAIATAAAGGELLIECTRVEDLELLLLKLEQAGARVQTGDGWFRIARDRQTPLQPIDMSTWTFPGFPTDLQAQYMALMTQADGESVISEYVHENRFQHVRELAKIGAGITVEGRLHAIVHGPARLRGTELAIPDIRSGAALVIAALCAEGDSVLRNVWHLERGYEDMVGKLSSVGARIKSVRLDSDAAAGHRLYE